MSIDLHFTKGQGTGNDFVLIADPEGELDLTPEQIHVLAAYVWNLSQPRQTATR